MTDVLLAHAFFLANDPKQLAKMRPYPPLATLFAAGQLRRAGYSVALFDATFAAGVEAFAAALDRRRPRLVALYEDSFHFLNKMCLGHAREAACRMAESARGRGVPVVAAGADVTDHPEVYLDRGVDVALVGEADRTLVELTGALLGGASGNGRVAGARAAADRLAGIAGLAYRRSASGNGRPRDNGDAGARSGNGGGAPDPAAALVRTAPREPERDPDVFGLPAWDLVDAAPYRAAWRKARGFFSLNLVTTRGCPFHCNWCAKPVWGQRYAMRSPAAVAEEMALVKRTLAPDHLWFADDIFGLQPRWVAELAREVAERDAAVPFMIQSRVDLMTEKTVAALARLGCVEVWLGVESGSQRVLDAMDKGTRVEQVPAARERLRAAGIRACFFLQFGYPGETFADVAATVELVRATLPDDVGISVSYPLPGTPFHRMVADQLGDRDHWRDSDELAMLFAGTYRTPFYRRLHRFVHRDLEVRRALAAGDAGGGVGEGNGNGDPDDAGRADLRAELARLEAAWRELAATEADHRSERPTTIVKPYPAPAPPDLSRTCN